MSVKQIANREVSAVFAAYPPKVRKRLLRLRKLILDTAENTQGVGALTETLKWNEPAYLTAQSKSGSTIRMNQLRNKTQYALFFNCHTNLVDSFRTLFPDTFRYDGNRSIVFDIDGDIPEQELQICIAMALTYHKQKKR